ncbi:hypothetical protein ABMA27_005721 [Loxostege sticticalis]|uniref:Uncharacterized protein n=1 Tax=Loxostege sticticalis TaxID=481309 RepID=A0ABR3HK90_LOXSC
MFWGQDFCNVRSCMCNRPYYYKDFLFTGSLDKHLLFHDLRLQRVIIANYDPSYIKDPTTFTSRSKRGDTYKTNLTVTVRQTWSKNITSSYHVVNMELKPQDFPLPLPSGEHYVGILFVLTKTRHVFLDVMGAIHVVK